MALYYDAPAIAELNNWTANLNNGYLQFMSGSQPPVNGALTGSEVAKLALSSTAFATATASNGVVTAVANTISSDTNATGGTIGYAALLKSDGSTVVVTCSVAAGGGGDITMANVFVSSSATVACAGLIVSQPES